MVRISIEDLVFNGRVSITEFEETIVNCFHIEAKPGEIAQNGGFGSHHLKILEYKILVDMD